MKRTALFQTVVVLIGLTVHLSFTSCQSQPQQKEKIHETIAATTQKDSLPKAAGYVNDFERLYTPDQKAYLEQLLAEFNDSTTIQIAVVTLDSTFTNNSDFDNYTLKLLRYWGVGQSGKNNGMLIGVSASLRQMRIQNGYGIEGVLSDSQTKKFVDNAFIPRFKEGNYYKGTLDGITAIMQFLRKAYK